MGDVRNALYILVSAALDSLHFNSRTVVYYLKYCERKCHADCFERYESR